MDATQKRTADLVEQVFRETCDDFYAWEQEYSRQSLARLRAVPAPVPTYSQDEQTLPESLDLLSIDDDDEGGEFTVTYSNGQTRTIKPLEITLDAGDLEPTPAYEACTPTSRNIMHGDDDPLMPFQPYYDDETFDYEDYYTEYEGQRWLMPNRDPDLEIIVLETAQRLVTRHQIPLQNIEEVGVLPLHLWTIDHKPGVLVTSQRRDFPPFPMTPTPIRLPQSHLSDGPKAITENITKYFCSNPGCVIGYCTTHTGVFPPIQPIQTQLNDTELRNLCKKPCGDQCFLLSRPQDSMKTHWSNSDIETLQVVLFSSPETVPCDLSVICRKPCLETFLYSKRLRSTQITHTSPPLEDTKSSESTAQVENAPESEVNSNARSLRPRVVRVPAPIYADEDSTTFSPDGPCSHEGPCDATISPSCSCVANKAHCENWCRCSSQSFKHRDPRYQASADGKAVTVLQESSQNPKMVPRHRERRVELQDVLAMLRGGNVTQSCVENARPDSTSDVCQNVAIQRDVRKLTDIRRSKYGFGLFALERIEKHEYIDEYTGELIYDATTRSRDKVAYHRKRSYLFGLNSTLSIDGSYAGNQTRFINHDMKIWNCHAQVKIVNGEHRIGIFAMEDIEPGTELFMNYGHEFWGSQDQEDSHIVAD